MLPEHEWLPYAKRLAVGMKQRIKHRSERRPNLIVANEGDKYWAYCQACREGGVLPKEHVRYTGIPSPEAHKSNLSIPEDIELVLSSEHEIPVARFLATKGMDLQMLPGLLYSHSRKRLIIETPQGSMGRDITGRALEKWLTYNGQHYLGVSQGNQAVVVEDTFSWKKLQWALTGWDVFCSLGTGQHLSLILELLKSPSVVFMYDGDAAGYKGANEGASTMRALGRRAVAACAPAGMDPKDMQGPDIVKHLEGVW